MATHGDSKVIFGVSDVEDVAKVRSILFWLWDLWGSPSSSFPFGVTDSRWDRFVEFEDEHSRQCFRRLALRVTWESLVHGVLTPDQFRDDTHFPNLSLTEFGRDVVGTSGPVPYDPAGFRSKVEAEAGECADKAVLEYLSQALVCFNSNLFVPAVLLLGISAEAMMWKLKDVLVACLKEPSQKNALKKAEHAGALIRQIDRILEAHAKRIRNEKSLDGVDLSSKSLADLIRRQRNELGHPQEDLPAVDARSAFSYFFVYANLAADLGRLSEYCRKNGL